jgi:galactokinase/mevalonate kinase-like predicted kinase
MILIGLLGKVCALAGDAPRKNELIASEARRLENFILSSVCGVQVAQYTSIVLGMILIEQPSDAGAEHLAMTL